MEQSGAAASIYYESGTSTKIMCSLYGPMTVQAKAKGTECEIRVFINFLETGKDKDAKADENSEIQKAKNDLKSTLSNVIIVTEYPKSQIEFNFEVLECDGYLLSHLMNASSIVLQAANLKSYDMFLSSATALDEKDRILVDPSLEELERAQSVLCIGYMLNSKNLPYIMSKGKTNNEILEKGLSFNISTCSKVSKAFEEFIFN